MKINDTQAKPVMVGFLREGKLHEFAYRLLKFTPKGEGVPLKLSFDEEEEKLLRGAQAEVGTSLAQALIDAVKKEHKEPKMKFAYDKGTRVFTSVAA